MKSVLVIDDEKSIRHALARALGRAGYLVETAATGGEGIDRIAQSPFDAILVDLHLPDLNGLEVVAFCTDTCPQVPVIVLTGFGTVESAMQAMRHGARDFVQKPFGMTDLVALLEREIADARPRKDATLRARVERGFSPEAHARVDTALRQAAALTGDPSSGALPLSIEDARRRFEVHYFKSLLARTHGNVAAAARLAGITRPKLHIKLQTLGLDARRFRPSGRPGPRGEPPSDDPFACGLATGAARAPAAV